MADESLKGSPFLPHTKRHNHQNIMIQTSMTVREDMSTLKNEVLDACKSGITLKLLSIDDSVKKSGLEEETERVTLIWSYYSLQPQDFAPRVV